MGVEPTAKFPGWTPETASRTKTAVTVPNKGTMDPGDYIGLVMQNRYFAANDRAMAARVAWRESRGRPRSINPQPVGGGCKGSGSRHATGMFQIVPACWPVVAGQPLDESRLLADPAYATEIAAEIVKQSGWRPWTMAGAIPDDFAGAEPTTDWWYWYQAAQVRGYMNGRYFPPGDGGTATTGIGPVDAGVNAINEAGGIADFFTSWDTWRTVLFVAGGGVLVVLGVTAVANDLGARLPLPGPAGAIAGALT